MHRRWTLDSEESASFLPPPPENEILTFSDSGSSSPFELLELKRRRRPLSMMKSRFPRNRVHHTLKMSFESKHSPSLLRPVPQNLLLFVCVLVGFA